MGDIIIVSSEAMLPDGVDRHLRSSLLDLSTRCDESTEEWFRTELRAGSQTPIGAEILAAIAAGAEDIYIIPIVSMTYGSQFDPEIPGAVLNFADGGYIASEDPQPMKFTVKLFHELGHAVQWITRRDWFTAKSSRELFRRDGYFREIEADNLVRHEWPLCRQLNLPARMHYEDFFQSREEAFARWEVTSAGAIRLQSAIRGFLARKKLAEMKRRQGLL